MDPATLAATIGSSVVGLAGVVFGWWSGQGQLASARDLAREQHEHERALARDERLSAELGVAYREMLLVNATAEDAIARTNSIHGPPLPPPRMPTDDERRALWARVAAVASPDVLTAWQTALDASRMFWIANQAVTEARRERPGVVVDLADLQRARDAFHRASRALEAAVRADLRA